MCGDLFTPHNLRQAVHDLQEIAGRWHDERDERRKAVESQIKDVKRRNSKLYEVLEEQGRETPNLGDLTRRLRDNNAQLKKLEIQRTAIDAELPPHVEIGEEDLADVLIATVKGGDNPAKTRALFADFLKKITVESASVRIEYDSQRLVGVLPPETSRTVPGNGHWLPSADSNHGPSD